MNGDEKRKTYFTDYVPEDEKYGLHIMKYFYLSYTKYFLISNFKVLDIKEGMELSDNQIKSALLWLESIDASNEKLKYAELGFLVKGNRQTAITSIKFTQEAKNFMDSYFSKEQSKETSPGTIPKTNASSSQNIRNDSIDLSLNKIINSQKQLSLTLTKQLNDSIEENTALMEQVFLNVKKNSVRANEIITIIMMLELFENLDPYTAIHCYNVADLTQKITESLYPNNDIIYQYTVSALLHDIGKYKIPSNILTKPGKVSKIEYNHLKQHPVYGKELLQVHYDFSNDPTITEIMKNILQHHERLDGNGYPEKIKGKDISTGAKIIAVVDVVEAMTNHRPYRAALSMDEAVSEISKSKCYDSEIRKSCIDIFNNGYLFPFKSNDQEDMKKNMRSFISRVSGLF